LPWSKSVFSSRGKAEVQAAVVVDRSTKRLIKRIKPGEIALIHHCDLDQVAAKGLIEKGVSAVLNCSDTFSGTYPTPGPEILVQAGNPALDGIDEVWMDVFSDGVTVWMDGGRLGYVDESGKRVAASTGYRLTR